MSNLYQVFEMDKDLEREGITVNYGSVKFLIARAGGRNKAFKTVFGAKTKKYRHQIDNETLTDDAADRIIIESYAEAVVFGDLRCVQCCDSRSDGCQSSPCR